jgi:hypothetical protein
MTKRRPTPWINSEVCPSDLGESETRERSSLAINDSRMGSSNRAEREYGEEQRFAVHGHVVRKKMMATNIRKVL